MIFLITYDTTPFSHRKHVFAYPLPTSFPRSIVPPDSIAPREPQGILSRSHSTTALSTLTTTTNAGALLRGYATFVGNFVKRRLDPGSTGIGIETGDVRELHNELWTVVDGYGGGGDDQ